MNGALERHTNYWLENLQGKNKLRDIPSYQRIILKWTRTKECVKLWTGFISVRRELAIFITPVNLPVPKRWEIQWLAAKFSTSHVCKKKWDSTVSIVTKLWSEQHGTGLLAGVWDLSVPQKVQIESGAHPASIETCATGFLPIGKAGGMWGRPLTSFKCWG